MKVSDIPFYDRPAQRLKKYGAGVLTDSELLTNILYNGKNDDIFEICNKLLKKYNLHKIYDIGFEVLKEECNNDEIATLKILSLVQLCKRYGTLVKGGYSVKPISEAEDVFNLLSSRVRDYNEEHLYVICLDTKNVVKKVHRICIGTLNSSLVHPREVFKAAIKEDSNSIILAHNHPSGDIVPSEADKQITEKIEDGGKLLKIEVKDHVIIGRDKYYSFRENKYKL
jgi:DNA repair protein RadC